MLQGYFNVAEKSYQSIKAFSKLSTFYAIQGCQSKLTKMQNISRDLNNKNDVFENSLLLGSVKDKIKVLMQSGQTALAYMTAKAHGSEYIEMIEEEMRSQGTTLTSDFSQQLDERVNKAKSIYPCRPVFINKDAYNTANWPVTMLVENVSEEAASQPSEPAEEVYHDASEDKQPVKPSDDITGLDDTDDFNQPDAMNNMDAGNDVVEGDKWGNEIELDDDLLGDLDAGDDNIDPDNIDFDIDINEDQSNVALDPIKSADPLQKIAYQSEVAAHHIILCNFDDAIELLKKQVGLSDPHVYDDYFDTLYSNAKLVVPKLPKTFEIDTFMKAQTEENLECIITLDSLRKLFKDGMTHFKNGAFKEALASMKECITKIPISFALESEQEGEIKKLIASCTEYIIALRIELKRKEIQATAPMKDSLELAILMTMCKLHPSLQFLTYKNAMNLCYKAQNFKNAAYFARKIVGFESTGVS